MIFFCFLGIGLAASVTLLFIIDLKISQYLAFALLGSIILLILSLDYTDYASKRLIKLFYGPIFFESLLLLLFILLFLFRLPELCCPSTRWTNLYLNSQLFLAIFVINFLYSLHSTFLRVVKLEEGSLSQADQNQYLSSEF